MMLALDLCVAQASKNCITEVQDDDLSVDDRREADAAKKDEDEIESNVAFQLTKLNLSHEVKFTTKDKDEKNATMEANSEEQLQNTKDQQTLSLMMIPTTNDKAEKDATMEAKSEEQLQNAEAQQTLSLIMMTKTDVEVSGMDASSRATVSASPCHRALVEDVVDYKDESHCLGTYKVIIETEDDVVAKLAEVQRMFATMKITVTAKTQDEQKAQTSRKRGREEVRPKKEWKACLSPNCMFLQSGYNEEPYTKYAGDLCLFKCYVSYMFMSCDFVIV